jgi:TDG/mug DNA glycosylase family protein
LSPTREQIAAAADARLRDVLRPGLFVLFCGINPGLYSGAVGHHFARPGNRFWPALHQAGFTDRVLSPFEDHLLPKYGLGVTNLVNRATRSAAELSSAELRASGKALARKVRRYRPKIIAFLGVSAYRKAFDVPASHAKIGPQLLTIAGTRIWLLPNPSGRTAAYKPADFVALFKRLRRDAMSSVHAPSDVRDVVSRGDKLAPLTMDRLR